MNKEQKEQWDSYYDTVNEQYVSSDFSEKDLLEWKYRRYMEDYLGSVAAVDDNIGRILTFLDDHELSQNTLIIYTSDQGFYLGEHGWYDKRFMYEESLRMPWVMRYPGAINSSLVLDEIVLNLDFAPTILDYAGVPIPEQMQGRSVRDLLENDNISAWRTSMYYEYFEYPHGWHSVKQHYGVRNNRYKLIHFHNDIDTWELYDLQKDINEVVNLYDDENYRQVRTAMHKELEQLRSDLLVSKAQ